MPSMSPIILVMVVFLLRSKPTLNPQRKQSPFDVRHDHFERLLPGRIAGPYEQVNGSLAPISALKP